MNSSDVLFRPVDMPNLNTSTGVTQTIRDGIKDGNPAVVSDLTVDELTQAGFNGEVPKLHDAAVSAYIYDKQNHPKSEILPKDLEIHPKSGSELNALKIDRVRLKPDLEKTGIGNANERFDKVREKEESARLEILRMYVDKVDYQERLIEVVKSSNDLETAKKELSHHLNFNDSNTQNIIGGVIFLRKNAEFLRENFGYTKVSEVRSVVLHNLKKVTGYRGDVFLGFVQEKYGKPTIGMDDYNKEMAINHLSDSRIIDADLIDDNIIMQIANGQIDSDGILRLVSELRPSNMMNGEKGVDNYFNHLFNGLNDMETTSKEQKLRIAIAILGIAQMNQEKESSNLRDHRLYDAGKHLVLASTLEQMRKILIADLDNKQS